MSVLVSPEAMLVKSGRVSPHFTVEEFRCSCSACRHAAPAFPLHWRLVRILEAIRRAVARPVHVRSGYRCEAHNAAVGGVEDSYHLTGEAADIHVLGCEAPYLADLARGAGAGGLGLYGDWIHVDVGPERIWWG